MGSPFSGHGGLRKLPWAFTEHGAIMAATLLRSPCAVAMSVYVVRAFVHMREELATSCHGIYRLSSLGLPVYLFCMNYREAISRWQALPLEQRRALRWAAIPRQVAASMAFEDEPVDPLWLEKLHALTTPPAGSKPVAVSSAHVG